MLEDDLKIHKLLNVVLENNAIPGNVRQDRTMVDNILKDHKVLKNVPN